MACGYILLKIAVSELVIIKLIHKFIEHFQIASSIQSLVEENWTNYATPGDCTPRQETGLSYSTCQKAAKKAKLKAYRITVVQELKPLDTPKRMAYCEWFMNLFGEDDELLDITWYSDETWFHLNGYVNSQNTRIWATEHPHEIHEVPLHSEKTDVWCAISRRRIIGPIFFHETLNTARYLEIFTEFVDQLDDDEL